MSEFEQIESSQRQHHNEMEHQLALEILEIKHQFSIMSMLKPKIYKDGNQWCVLYGQNIQEGFAGFGNTPMEAIKNFNNNFNQK